MGFSRQEYRGGWPFPSPGDLPDPGTEPGPPALEADSSPSETGETGEKQLQRVRVHALAEARAVSTPGGCAQLEVDQGRLSGGGDLDSGS